MGGRDVVSVAAREWAFFFRLVLRLFMLLLALVFCGRADAQAVAASGVAVMVVVCAEPPASGTAGVLTSSGGSITCNQTDANGVALVPEVSTQFVAVDAGADGGDDGGVQVGLDVGGAVLGVLAIAYGFRVIRNFINSSSEG
jgi:hypothetical protein